MKTEASTSAAAYVQARKKDARSKASCATDRVALFIIFTFFFCLRRNKKKQTNKNCVVPFLVLSFLHVSPDHARLSLRGALHFV